MIAPIQVWRFHQAPRELRVLVDDVDDVDWLALLPAGCEVPDWMRGGGAFACAYLDLIHIGRGRTIAVSHHA